MKFLATITIALSLLLSISAQPRKRRTATPPPPAPASSATRNPASAINQLPLKRVILYSNGVAYFERRGHGD